jgi:prophage regulatory protein
MMSFQAGSTDMALQILRLPQVCAVTGLKRSMIYQLEADQRFPHRIKIGIRAVGWIEGEVRMWVATRIAESRRTLKHSV